MQFGPISQAAVSERRTSCPTDSNALTISPRVPQAKATLSRLPSLDGWRAVSILIVLASHWADYASGFPSKLKPVFGLFFDGNLGVRFFFVISGFLITWLMILERENTGTVNLREFYIRRSLRILPVYLAFLCVLAVLDWTGGVKESAQAWIGNLTFTRNLRGGLIEGDSYSSHVWSLSVEEWFYLIWPTIFLLSTRKCNRSILSVLAIPVLAGPAVREISFRWFHPGIFYSQLLKPVFFGNAFFKYFDSLALGCVCAVLLFHQRETIECRLKRWAFLTAGTGATLVLLPFFHWPLKDALAVEFNPSIQALGFSILLLHSVIAPEWKFYRLLNWSWVRRIGVWSYSIYIWQQLVWKPPQSFGLDRIWWIGLWMIPLFLITIVSYYGLERPFFKLRSRYREVIIGQRPDSNQPRTTPEVLRARE